MARDSLPQLTVNVEEDTKIGDHLEQALLDLRTGSNRRPSSSGKGKQQAAEAAEAEAALNGEWFDLDRRTMRI